MVFFTCNCFFCQTWYIKATGFIVRISIVLHIKCCKILFLVKFVTENGCSVDMNLVRFVTSVKHSSVL